VSERLPALFPRSLPVSEFPKFKEFVLTTAPKGYPCDVPRWPDWITPLWTLTHAAGAALSCKHALGHPGRFAESAKDEEESALRDLLARFNSPEWEVETDYLVLVPGGGDDAITFAWDVDGRGHDQSAWAPDRDLVKRLNTWCRTALDAFYAAQQRVEPNDPGPAGWSDAAVVPPPTRQIACRLTVSYAGFEGESELLEGLYKRGIAGKQLAPDLYAAGGLLLYWTHQFTAPWQTEEWREQMREQLLPNAYLRLIENRWVSTESSFVDLTWSRPSVV
jgi:hypothetical protein